MMNLAELANRKMKFRPSFGLMMRDLLLSREDVVFLVADSARACRFECPESCQDRLVECGIAEQNMIGVAAGLARAGKKPIAFAFSPFACERCFEQVRVDVAYSGLGVVIVGSEGGVGMGTQGVTHYGWEDMAVMRSLPGMTVMDPADHVELYHCLEKALDMNAPVYIRLSGGIPSPVYLNDCELEIGKAHELRAGTDATIIAVGTMVSVALEAASLLEAKGLSVGVADMWSLKPLDEDFVLKYASSVSAIVTLEEHSVVNGLGSAVADALAQHHSRARLTKLGLPDAYPPSVSPYPVMLEDYGLTAGQVASSVEKAIRSARESQ